MEHEMVVKMYPPFMYTQLILYKIFPYEIVRLIVDFYKKSTYLKYCSICGTLKTECNCVFITKECIDFGKCVCCNLMNYNNLIAMYSIDRKLIVLCPKFYHLIKKKYSEYVFSKIISYFDTYPKPNKDLTNKDYLKYLRTKNNYEKIKKDILYVLHPYNKFGNKLDYNDSLHIIVRENVKCNKD
jgi:hypothetical protein